MQYQASFSQTKRVRFQAPDSGLYVITAQALCWAQSLLLTTTTAQPLFDRLRIVSVEIYGPMDSSLTPVTVSVEWINPGGPSFGSPSKIYSDTSMGSALCAFVKTHPPKDSHSSMWLNPLTSAGPLMNITIPDNSIIDFTVEYVYNDGETPLAVKTITTNSDPIGTIICVPPISGFISVNLPNGGW